MSEFPEVGTPLFYGVFFYRRIAYGCRRYVFTEEKRQP